MNDEADSERLCSPSTWANKRVKALQVAPSLLGKNEKQVGTHTFGLTSAHTINSCLHNLYLNGETLNVPSNDATIALAKIAKDSDVANRGIRAPVHSTMKDLRNLSPVSVIEKHGMEVSNSACKMIEKIQCS